MSTTLKSVLERVVGTMEDLASVTYTLQDLVRYANDGAVDMHVRRPDLFNVEADHALVAGTKQTLPANGSKLIDVSHNTVGDMLPVTKVNRSDMDSQFPGWRRDTASLSIDHFMYDDREPTVFENYPPALVGARAMVKFAQIPTAMPIPADGTQLAAITGDINVPDLQQVTLQHYICARCYAEGGEDANPDLAQRFLSWYASDLGVEIEATKTVAPTPNKP